MSNTAQTDWRIERDADDIAWLCFDKAGTSTNVLSGQVMLELGEQLKTLAASPPEAWSSPPPNRVVSSLVRISRSLPA